MAERPGDEDFEITGAEKLLAFLLAVFLAVGAIWAYVEVEDQIREQPSHLRALALQRLDDSDRAAIEQFDAAVAARARAKRKGDQAAAAAARERVHALRPTSVAAQNRLSAEVEALRHESNRRLDSQNLRIFGLRMAMLILLLGAGLWLLSRGAARLGRWRLLPASLLTAAATLAVVMAIDYGQDLVDFADLGPGLISLIGVILTLVTMVAVQRSVARRLPQRRVRRGLCPFCGYPGAGGEEGGRHCEGCGRDRLAACHVCAQPRRVGVRYCGHCGSA